MNRIEVIVATYGDPAWLTLARERALPSVFRAGFDCVTQIHLEDGTLALARNVAAGRSVAEWLCFLDADDELASGYALEMLTACELVKVGRGLRPANRLLVPAVQYRGSDGSYKGQPGIPNIERPITELNHGVIGTVVPRWLFSKVGGFRELPLYEDWDLWLRCIRKGAALDYVDNAVYMAWQSRDGRNSPSSHLRQSTYNLIKRQHLEAISA